MNIECRELCPYGYLGRLELLRGVDNSSIPGQLAWAGLGLALAAHQLNVRANCESRGLPVSEWVPDKRCIKLASDFLDKFPIDISLADVNTIEVLGPYNPIPD